MLTWAFYRQGRAEWMRGYLEAVLAPYVIKRVGERPTGSFGLTSDPRR
jgi:hypothetical protein